MTGNRCTLRRSTTALLAPEVLRTEQHLQEGMRRLQHCSRTSPRVSLSTQRTVGKVYTRRSLGRSGGAYRRHHIDAGRALGISPTQTTTTTSDDLKCTNQPAAHQPLPPRSLNQLRRLLRSPTRDLEEGRGPQGLGGIRNSADERGQPSSLPRSRPDVTARA